MSDVGDEMNTAETENCHEDSRELSQSRKSQVWNYFQEVDAKRVKCKLCMKNNRLHKKTLMRNSDSGTTNMLRHLRTKHMDVWHKEQGLEEKGKQQTIPDAISSSSVREFTGISFSVLKDYIAEYVCKLDRPWRAVQDRRFRRLLRSCAQKRIKIPSRKTIRRHCMELYEREMSKLYLTLHEVRRVSLTIDAWTTDNKIALLGVTVHWIDDDWKLRERVLGLQHLDGDHTGENMCEVLKQLLFFYDIQDKICAVTTDNASNNNTMIDALIPFVNYSRSPFDRSHHMPCLAHVVNLAVQDGLKQLFITSSDSSVPTEPPADTDVNDEVLQRSMEEGRSLGSIVNRIRQLLKAIRISTERLQRYRGFTKELGNLSCSVPQLDCPTRWNSTYDMLISASEQRNALENMAFFGLKGVSKSNFLITEDEWKIISDLILVLEPFQEMTDFLCQSKKVTAAKALLVIRLLNNSLKSHLSRLERGENSHDDVHCTIANVCRAMVLKIEKYEERLRGSNAFSVAAVLDPRTKMEQIPIEDQAAVKAKLVKLYDKIKDQDVTPLVPPHTMPSSSSSTKTRRGKKGAFSCLLDEWENRPAPVNPDEVEAYLQSALVNMDALTWWRLEGSRLSPKLAILAKDYLAVCATSAPAERFFFDRKKRDDTLKEPIECEECIDSNDS